MSSPGLFKRTVMSDQLTFTETSFGFAIGQSDNILVQDSETPLQNLIGGVTFDVSEIASQIGNAAIPIVTGLPALPDPAYPQGTVVFLTSDNKLYRSTGSTWTTLVNGADIAANSITTNMIIAGAVTAAKIAANTITAAQIAANTITATQIAANTITAAQIAAATITTTQIAALTIVAGNIAAGTITAGKLSVSQLSAISADVGALTAGSLTGLTITGGTIQTASSGGRVVLTSSNGVEVKDSGGTTRTQLNVSGGNAGFLTTTDIYGVSGLSLAYDNGFNLATLHFSTAQCQFSMAGSTALTIDAAAINAPSGAVFTGDGSGLTGISVSATDITSGTLSSARLDSDVALFGGGGGGANINFTSGFGIASGGVGFACASHPQVYHASTLVADFSTGGTQINIGGTLYTLSVVAGIVNAT